MKWRALAMLLVIVAALTWGFVGAWVPSDRGGMTHTTLARAQQLVHGCMAYRKKPAAGGRYPAKLRELIETTPVGGPFVDLPGGRIVDAWGNPFRYALVQTEAGGEVPYVWAEYEDEEGRITLVGAKGLTDGTVVFYGVPK